MNNECKAIRNDIGIYEIYGVSYLMQFGKQCYADKLRTNET